MAKSYSLTRRQVVPCARQDLFAFFADAANLNKLTPPELRFRILTPLPITMGVGTQIEYRLQLLGIPFKWLTHIDAFESDAYFVDRQARGPYKLWRHEHAFRDIDGGTEMTDTVHYQLPAGPLGGLAHALFVRRQLDKIFDYRARVIGEIWPGGEFPLRRR